MGADLKTFESHGVWGTAAVTAVTAQNTVGVHEVATLAPSSVRAQVESVVRDIGVDAAKTGILVTAGIVREVARAVRELAVPNLVVDPVLSAGTGERFSDDDAVAALRDELLPLATVVTPNLAEAARLTGRPAADVGDGASMESAASTLLELGARVVMVTGGHLGGERSPDLVAAAGSAPVWLDAPRLAAGHTHGSGCVLSAAVCAELARGMEPADACVAAKRFAERAIAAGFALGAGAGPVDPGWAAASLPPP